MKVIRPICTICDRCFGEKTGKPKHHGKFFYGTKCSGCRREKTLGSRNPKEVKRKYNRPWVIFKKDFCEKCGFVAKHPCQLGVDHKDGNRENNAEDNYQTLCSNCHRLKTQETKEFYSTRRIYRTKRSQRG